MADNKTQETLELSCYLVNTYADYTFKVMEKMQSLISNRIKAINNGMTIPLPG